MCVYVCVYVSVFLCVSVRSCLGCFRISVWWTACVWQCAAACVCMCRVVFDEADRNKNGVLDNGEVSIPTHSYWMSMRFCWRTYPHDVIACVYPSNRSFGSCWSHHSSTSTCRRRRSTRFEGVCVHHVSCAHVCIMYVCVAHCPIRLCVFVCTCVTYILHALLQARRSRGTATGYHLRGVCPDVQKPPAESECTAHEWMNA